MKTIILKIATAIAISTAVVSCTNDNTELIKQIEGNKTELLKIDSALNKQHTTLSTFIEKDSAGQIEKADSAQLAFLKMNSDLKLKAEEFMKLNADLLEKINKKEVSKEQATEELKTLETKTNELTPLKDSLQKQVDYFENTFVILLKALSDSSSKK